MAFYNDLGDYRSLNAQTAALNSAKQAKGPEAWMPPANRCEYVGNWIAVKIRWGLRVDSAEKAALIRYADSCRTCASASPRFRPAREPRSRIAPQQEAPRCRKAARGFFVGRCC